MVSGERAPELLRADKEQLDRAAYLLRGDEPGFVIVVCPGKLVAAARAHMSEQAGVEIPVPAVLQGSEEALAALVGERPDLAGAKVRSLTVGGDAKETLRAVNWHREKLLRGAPVVLWIDGVDGLTEMRDAAPDAYAFRDVVVMVRGDGGRLPQVPYKDSRSVLHARRRVARARTALERADAHGQLSHDLRVHGHLIESETVARRGLESLSPERFADETARLARARLWGAAAMAALVRGSQVRQRRGAQQGLAELEGVTLANARETRIWLLSVVPGPHAHRDRLSAEEALVLAQQEPSRTAAYAQALGAAASVARGLGAIDRARSLFARAASLPLDSINKSILARDLASLAASAGRMHDVELYLKESTSLGRTEQLHSASDAYLSGWCWLQRGEPDTAEKVLEDSLADEEPTDLVHKAQMLAAVALARGEVELALTRLRLVLRTAAQFALDADHISGCQALSELSGEAHDAAVLDDGALQRLAAELDVAEDVSRALTENAPPPWYSIRLLLYRADVLIRTDRHDEALDVARRAHILSRTTCEDLIPEAGCTLADQLLRTGNPAEALPLLVEIEAEAVSRGMLKDLARIRAAQVLALVLRNEPPTAIEPVMAALREALESTGAPRIKAETLQELAIRLPPTTSLPDPLELAAETHTLFVEMPMIEKEARSLELAGDVLAARGKPDDARRRYLTAKAILERRGLGLRLSLLSSKIQRLD